MSVVVPAYNEEARIKIMLAEAVNYLEKIYSGDNDWEILVVNDGSTDNTSNVVLSWAVELQKKGAFDDGQLRLCRLEKNRGKGGAVSHVFPISFNSDCSGHATCSRAICDFCRCRWS
jgi:dolichyl-phosphate beta-glucosyltransferase